MEHNNNVKISLLVKDYETLYEKMIGMDDCKHIMHEKNLTIKFVSKTQIVLTWENINWDYANKAVQLIVAFVRACLCYVYIKINNDCWNDVMVDRKNLLANNKFDENILDIKTIIVE